MPESDPSFSAPPPGCYHLEHAEHYQYLVGELPDPLRQLWVSFVESTAVHTLKCERAPVGRPLPEFSKISAALDQGVEDAAAATRFIVVAFSFGVSFPFCSLAFKHLLPIWPELRQQGIEFICLFPPESAPHSGTQPTSEEQVPTLIDAGAECAAHCGLRMPLEERFRPLVEEVAWFPGHAAGEVPTALTLPGTCILSPQGILLDRHLPADVTRRLPPEEITARIENLNDSISQSNPNPEQRS